MNISLTSLVSNQKSFDFSQRYGEHNLQPPSLELRDYTKQISEDVWYKWGCCSKRLQQQETLSASLYPATRGGFFPSLTQGDGCPELPSLDSDESLHSSGHTVLKSQCMLWKMLLPSVDKLCFQGPSVHHSCTHCKGYKYNMCTILQICVSY